MSSIPVTVIYDPDGANLDISDKVIFRTVTLQSAASAQPGTWTATVKDVDQTMTFVTGKRILWYLDGIVYYAGFITQISKAFAFPADDTSVPSAVKTRQFVLRGVDYNILFDKLVLRNPSNYLAPFPSAARAYSRTQILKLTSDYLDVPTWITYEEVKANWGYLPYPATMPDPTYNGTGTPPEVPATLGWNGQGDTWRRQMDMLAGQIGAIYYIKPYGTGARLVWGDYESASYSKTFSDNPAVDEIGFRELDYLEDGTVIVNDALVWGGTAIDLDGTSKVKFKREQDASSISTHNRWQWAESHLGDSNYASQTQVDQRAYVIVKGQTGDVIDQQNRGLKVPNKNFSLTWYQRQVRTGPTSFNIPKPGDITTLKLHVFGDGVDPVIEILPLRSLTLTFPNNDSDGTSYVKFTGTFSLQVNDPWTLWQAIRNRRKQILQTT